MVVHDVKGVCAIGKTLRAEDRDLREARRVLQLQFHAAARLAVKENIRGAFVVEFFGEPLDAGAGKSELCRVARRSTDVNVVQVIVVAALGADLAVAGVADGRMVVVDQRGVWLGLGFEDELNAPVLVEAARLVLKRTAGATGSLFCS